MDENNATSPDVDERMQEWLRERGFLPGETVHSDEVSFTLDEVKASLFESTYSRPTVIVLASSDGITRLPVVIDLATPFFLPNAVQYTDSPAGYYEKPEWCFRGWVLPSGYGASYRPTRVWIWVGSGFDEDMYWQVIPEDANGQELIFVSPE